MFRVGLSRFLLNESYRYRMIGTVVSAVNIIVPVRLCSELLTALLRELTKLVGQRTHISPM